MTAKPERVRRYKIKFSYSEKNASFGHIWYAGEVTVSAYDTDEALKQFKTSTRRHEVFEQQRKPLSLMLRGADVSIEAVGPVEDEPGETG